MLAHSVSAFKGKGMAKYYIRGGKIWIVYYVDKIRHRKSTGLDESPVNIKTVTQVIIPALTTSIATGEIYKKKPKSFRHYGNIFLKEKSSIKSYFLKHKYFERVIDYFGNKDIDRITRLDIKEYLLSLDMKSVSKSTYKSCIKEIFELAVDDAVISTNPALNIKLKSNERTEVKYYSKEEVLKLLSVADGITKAYLEIAFNTGMRVGEILGLQISDFKDDGYIHIKRTRTKGVLGSGKTNNALRKVPYPDYVLEEVMKVHPKDNLFIFGNIDDAGLLRRRWKSVCEDAGVEQYRLYATRHTFATLMLRENIVSINELAGLLGHSSPKVTLEYYASVIESKNINLGANFSLFRHNTDTAKNETSSKAL